MKYYIGADLGTSSCKMILCDQDGTILNSVTEYYDVHYPHSGWSEQNPEDWWEAFVKGVKKLTQGVDTSAIRSLAVAGQMHGLVILDKEDRVIRPVILWNDGRTFKENDYLNNTIGKERLSALTANISFAGFTAPKLLWIKENEPQNFDKIQKIMLPKDYINYRLTGVHACDYSDASGLLLLDVKNRKWSKEMLDICHIKQEQMPKLFESYEAIGSIIPKVAKELQLSDNVTVAAGAGDNAGAAIGTGTIGEGKCNISLGTSGTIFISSDDFHVDQNNSLHAFCHADGKYHLMGCILSAASCNGWFCDKILERQDYAALQEKINDDMLGVGGVYFLPYLMGERSPVNDTDASGVFIGLRPTVDQSEMLLSVLEGVAFAVRDNLEIAKKLGIDIQSSTVSGGGAKSPLWMKILANVLDIRLQIPATQEGPSLGAAILAKVACGDQTTVETSGLPQIRQVIEPDEKLVARYEEKYRRYQKIYPAMKQLFKQLKEGE